MKVQLYLGLLLIVLGLFHARILLKIWTMEWSLQIINVTKEEKKKPSKQGMGLTVSPSLNEAKESDATETTLSLNLH